jgi:hypothetical protein
MSGPQRARRHRGHNVAQLAVRRIQRGLTGDTQLLDDLLQLRLEPAGGIRVVDGQCRQRVAQVRGVLAEDVAGDVVQSSIAAAFSLPPLGRGRRAGAPGFRPATAAPSAGSARRRRRVRSHHWQRPGAACITPPAAVRSRTPVTAKSGSAPGLRRSLEPSGNRLLARRPYDLRHAAVTLWLAAGVPATEVARRAGHGVAVLLKGVRRLHRRPGRSRQPADQRRPRRTQASKHRGPGPDRAWTIQSGGR